MKSMHLHQQLTRLFYAFVLICLFTSGPGPVPGVSAQAQDTGTPTTIATDPPTQAPDTSTPTAIATDTPSTPTQAPDTGMPTVEGTPVTPEVTALDNSPDQADLTELGVTGATTRVSIATGGAQADSTSMRTSISADGRFVAFTSWSTNLVAGDTNDCSDIFVRDRQTGTTERVSVAGDGTQGNSSSDSPFISADGRFVAFESYADNLVIGDLNNKMDIFVHDRQTGSTELVSVSSTGTQEDAGAQGPALSADGRFVAFYSSATNLVAGDTNGVSDIFVHDRDTGITGRVSVASDGTQGNSFSYYNAISADGRFVAFRSDASNLVAGDTNNTRDIFVHDRQTGNTELISVSSGGIQGNNTSDAAAISADGRFVAFYSSATNLVTNDTNGTGDTFVRDRQNHTTERVSVASDGTQGNGGSLIGFPSVSADGRFVAFFSYASNLVTGDTNDAPDVFVRDRQTGFTERVSVANNDAQGNGQSMTPSISGDGRFVAFESGSYNLVTGDTNQVWDIFVRDRLANGCYTLTAAANYAERGTISTNPGPNCANGIGYTSNTVVQLIAHPATGYGFSDWSGSASGSSNPVSVTMSSNRSVTANFKPCYSLTTAVSPGGSGTISANPAPNCPTDPTKYAYGTVVQLTPHSVTGYGFSSWSGSYTGTSNPLSVTMTSNRSVTANFTACYTLTTGVTPVGGGTVSANPAPNCNAGSQYTTGTVVELTAHPAAGYAFSGWSGNLGTLSNPVLMTMNANKSETANFVPCYTLTTAVSPVGNGTVSAIPAPNCNAGSKYTPGTVVQLTAHPAAGKGFASWSGDIGTASNPLSVTMNANKSETANFVPCFTLTKAANYSDRGTISANPAPNCNAGTQYTSGTVVQLTAHPATGYGFSDWSGSATGTSNPVSVTMSSNRSVIANFRPCYSLTTAVNDPARGTVSANPAPNCATDPTKYAYATVVQLTANPKTSYSFLSWSGSIASTTNPVSVTMTANRSVTANFQACYTLTVAANYTNRGTISANPAPNCNSGTQYTSGTVVQLTAHPATGYGFSDWSGSATGTSNPVSVTMSSNRSVIANFRPCYSLTTAVNDPARGTVSANPAPNCATDPTKYAYATVVQLTANPKTGYSFLSWSGSIVSTTNPASVTMTANRSVTANFSISP